MDVINWLHAFLAFAILVVAIGGAALIAQSRKSFKDWEPMPRIGHYHKWSTVRDNGKTVYESCSSCGERRAWQRAGGHQPIDQHWIETGEWRKLTLPPGIGTQPGDYPKPPPSSAPDPNR